MCEVCAIFGAGEHWSDFARSRNERFPFGEIQNYRLERKRRIEVLNRLLRPRSLRCEDWDGETLAVIDRHGRSRLAATLTDVWPTIEVLSGSKIDPLQDDPIV